MKIELDVKRAAPIGVVRSLPEDRFLRLVGKNGVGKSLAANLLAIASGDYQFREELSFRTLRGALRSVDITITVDGHVLKVSMNPATWLWDDLRRRISPRSAGKFEIDGKEISSEDFSNLFSVKTVRGNEGLETQLADLGRAVISAYNLLFDKYQASAIELSKVAHDLRTRLRYRELEVIRDRRESYAERVHAAGVDPETVARFYRLLSSLAKVQVTRTIDVKINELKRSLKAKLEEGVREEARLIQGRKRLEESLTDNRSLLRDIGKVEEIQSKIQDLSAELPFRDEALQTPEGIDEEDERCKKLEEELIALNAEYQRMSYALGVQNEVPKVVVGLGADNERAGISIQSAELLTIRHPRVTRTTRQLLGDFAFSSRRTKEILKQNPALKDLDQRWEKLRERIEALALQRRLVGQLLKLRSDIREIQGRIDKQRAGGGEELASLSSRILATRQRNHAAQDALSLLEDPAFSREEREISKALLSALGIRDSDLRKALGSLRGPYDQVGELDIERKAIQTATNRYFQSLDQEPVSRVPKAVRAAISTRDLGKLLHAVARLNPLAATDWYEVMRQEVVQRIEQLAQPTSKEAAEGQDDFYRAVNEILGSILTNQLNEQPFRRFVFKDRVLGVDPASGIVKLDTRGGPSERSLNDFSTGERAFAYSVASILANRRPSKWSVLFLDEFGAVLDEDREQFLMKVVGEQMTDSKWPTKAVIMLPYKGDLDREEERLKDPKLSTSEKSQLREKIQRRRRQLDTDGYYSEPVGS